MTRIRTLPFDYRDLRGRPAPVTVTEAPAAPVAPALTAADIDAAFAAGYRAGEDTAMRSAESSAAARLGAVAADLAAQSLRFGAALDSEREAMRAAARELFQSILRGAWRRAELDGALALVDRLIAAAPDGPEAILRIHPEGVSRIGESLRRALGERNSAVIRIESDAAIEDGDCRLEWRGGAAARRMSDAIGEIDRILDSACAHIEAPQSEDSHDDDS